MCGTDKDPTKRRDPRGCIIAFLSFGFAATLVVLLAPMSADLGWVRAMFSLSVAVQALIWGISQPLAGAVADRYGTARVVAPTAATPAARISRGPSGPLFAT